MHDILQRGGDYDETVESIEKWMAFLTNPGNLRPGLKDLTIYFGDARFCSITATFSSTAPSLRSLKLELAYLDDEYARSIFEDQNGVKEWVPTMFLNSDLEDLSVEFLTKELPDLFHKTPKLKVVYISNSKLVRLPPSFFQLPALERLSIDGLSLPEVPAELGNLKTLQYLSFSQPYRPPVWGKLKGVTELSVYMLSASLPEDFLMFPKLERLYFQLGRQFANFQFTHSDVPRLKVINTNAVSAFVNVARKFPDVKIN